MIVPVYLPDRPSKASPLVSKRLKSQGFRHGAYALQLIVVHDSHQVIEPVVCCEKYCLPIGTLVAFAVAHQHKNPVLSPIELGAVSHPGTYRQPMTQRTGGELDTRNTLMRYVAAKNGTVLIMRIQYFDIKKASFRQCRIDAGTRVTLAENKSIPLRPFRILWIDVKN